MSLISDRELKEFNDQGLIPGPNESEETFLERVRYCLELNSQPASAWKDFFPSPGVAREQSEAILQEANEITKAHFGISPRWVPLFFSNCHLAPWHGGCAWIFQKQVGEPKGAILQLRKALKNGHTYLGIYKRKELLAHELAHIGRMAFDEPCFEEFFAYRVFSSPFRRWFGPILKSPVEGMMFLASVSLVFILDLFFIFMGDYTNYIRFMWIKGIPLLLIVLGFWRLVKKHTQFLRCLRKLQCIFESEEEAQAVMYRLSDQELQKFSVMTPDQIQQFACHNQSVSLRWRLLTMLYFRR